MAEPTDLEKKRTAAVHELRANILTELENAVIDLELEGEILTMWTGSLSKEAGDVLSHTTTNIFKWLMKFVKEAEGKDATA